MQNNLLSVLIPTYNRANFLDYSLEIHIPLLEKHNIQIIIFDNASTDNTQEVVNKWSEKYKYLIYHRHAENIGGIGNFEFALQYPSTEYVWMLGDTYQIEHGVIDYILDLLNTLIQKPDAIILNLENKFILPTSEYNDSNKLLNELGALITCIAVSILRKDMITEDILLRYRNLWFTHMAVVFESIVNREFQIYWLQEYSVRSLVHPTLQKINWSHTPKAFEIGCEDWTNFVMSLPPTYNIYTKMKCIMDFGKVSSLFSFQNLVKLRLKNILNINIFFRYKTLFKMTIDYPVPIIFFLSIFPRFLIRLFLILVIMVVKKDKIKKIKKILGFI